MIWALDFLPFLAKLQRFKTCFTRYTWKNDSENQWLKAIWDKSPGSIHVEKDARIAFRANNCNFWKISELSDTFRIYWKCSELLESFEGFWTFSNNFVWNFGMSELFYLKILESFEIIPEFFDWKPRSYSSVWIIFRVSWKIFGIFRTFLQFSINVWTFQISAEILGK